jgi:hypothetical protein
MNQVSPKIFEAIRLRTALVLFEGEYSGAVEAGRHYIPLARDFSNVDEVFTKLDDLDFLTALTERAFHEIIESGRYSYRAFVEGVDNHLDSYANARPRAQFRSVPTLAIYDGDSFVPLSGWRSPEASLGSHIVNAKEREALRQQMARSDWPLATTARNQLLADELSAGREQIAVLEAEIARLNTVYPEHQTAMQSEIDRLNEVYPEALHHLTDEVQRLNKVLADEVERFNKSMEEVVKRHSEQNINTASYYLRRAAHLLKGKLRSLAGRRTRH